MRGIWIDVVRSILVEQAFIHTAIEQVMPCCRQQLRSLRAKKSQFQHIDEQKQQNGNGGDDDYANMNSQYYNNNDQYDTSYSNTDYGQYQDDWAENNMNVADDDLFHWSDNLGFDGVSVMPVSCVN